MSAKKKIGRPREFDGPPVSVRITQETYDRLASEAFDRRKELSEVIRERLDRPNSYPKSGLTITATLH